MEKCFGYSKTIAVAYSPLQETPSLSSSKPSLQVHIKLPFVFLHPCWHWWLLLSHSSISGRIYHESILENINYYTKIAGVIINFLCHNAVCVHLGIKSKLLHCRVHIISWSIISKALTCIHMHHFWHWLAMIAINCVYTSNTKQGRWCEYIQDSLD